MPPTISYLQKQLDEKSAACKQKVDSIRTLMEKDDRTSKVDQLAEEIVIIISEIESISGKLAAQVVEGDPDESLECIDKLVPEAREALISAELYIKDRKEREKFRNTSNESGESFAKSLKSSGTRSKASSAAQKLAKLEIKRRVELRKLEEEELERKAIEEAEIRKAVAETESRKVIAEAEAEARKTAAMRQRELRNKQLEINAQIDMELLDIKSERSDSMTDVDSLTSKEKTQAWLDNNSVGSSDKVAELSFFPENEQILLDSFGLPQPANLESTHMKDNKSASDSFNSGETRALYVPEQFKSHDPELSMHQFGGREKEKVPAEHNQKNNLDCTGVLERNQLNNLVCSEILKCSRSREPQSRVPEFKADFEIQNSKVREHSYAFRDSQFPRQEYSEYAKVNVRVPEHGESKVREHNLNFEVHEKVAAELQNHRTDVRVREHSTSEVRELNKFEVRDHRMRNQVPELSFSSRIPDHKLDFEVQEHKLVQVPEQTSRVGERSWSEPKVPEHESVEKFKVPEHQHGNFGSSRTQNANYPPFLYQGQQQTRSAPDIRYLEKCLPTCKLDTFDGDALKWPEWCGMFENTVLRSGISNDEKMAHLKTLLTGSAKEEIAGFSFNSTMFEQAWLALKGKFGKPKRIVAAQMDKLIRSPPIKIHNSEQIIAYSRTVFSVVNVLTSLGYTADLSSSTNVQIAVEKLPPNLKENWFSSTVFLETEPTLGDFNTWLRSVSETHEQMLLTSRQSSRTLQKDEKKKSTTAFVKDSTKDTTCPYCSGKDHKLWKCSEFRNETPTERAEFAKSKNLCFTCLNEGHLANKCSRKQKCGQQGCKSSHSSLLHGAERVFRDKVGELTKSSGTPNNSQAMTVCAGSDRGLLQIVKVDVCFGSRAISTYALCDSGATHSWCSPDLKSSLEATGEKEFMTLQSFNGSAELECEKLTVSVKNDCLKKAAELQVFVKPDFHLGLDSINITALKKQYPHLQPVKSENVELSQVKLLLGQNAFEIIRPLEYRHNKPSEPWAVRLPLGWVVSGPVPKLHRQNCTRSGTFFNFGNLGQDEELSAQVRQWWDIESYASKVK